MTPKHDTEKELKTLEKSAEQFLKQLKAGDYYGARETALFMHYGAQALWHNN